MGKINCNDEMLFEKTVDSKTVFEGHVFDVEIKKIITPEGRESTREIVKHHGGACILPVDDEGNCYLVKQFFVAKNIECVGAVTATPGYCSEVITLFIGTGLETGDANPDLNEYISTVKMPLKEAVRMADDQEIEDAKTLVLIYKAARRLGI